MRRMMFFVAFTLALSTRSVLAQQEPRVLEVNANIQLGKVEPTMWGVFFEDINMGADGGIYAELIKNRSFEFTKPMMGWKILGKPLTEGDFTVLNRGDSDKANPRYLRINLHPGMQAKTGLSNEGFRGMGIKKDLRYDFSLLYRTSGSPKRLHLELVNAGGKMIGEAGMVLDGSDDPHQGEWKKQMVSFKAIDSSLKASLNIWIEGEGILDIDMVSLFPGDTWKQRAGGMRADMVQMLADMKPGFIRFPGGCIVEGFDLEHRYQWKKTIGPIEERQLIINRWNTEIANRPAADYFQTFGLGFFEYFQLAEDIGAAPLPILNCGMACQFNSAELVSTGDLDPYIQDAMDLIEFANGDTLSRWGKIRAGLGHPAPFGLKMMGIGNENWGPQYIERLKMFTRAIKAKYPAFKLVNSSGTDPDGERFDYLNKELRAMNADIIDEHYYRRPEWFFSHATRYDHYPRNGSRIFGGEYAAQSDHTVSINNANNWLTALSEAAFMTGLERNADVVTMASYAPLFAHADGWQWTPDLIWVNNLQSYGTPDYYVQKLFSLNKGTRVIAATLNGNVVAGQDSLFASSVIDSNRHEVIVKIVNASSKPQPISLQFAGMKHFPPTAILTELKGDELNSMNSFLQPMNVSPVDRQIICKDRHIELSLAAYSFNIVKLKW